MQMSLDWGSNYAHIFSSFLFLDNLLMLQDFSGKEKDVDWPDSNIWSFLLLQLKLRSLFSER